MGNQQKKASPSVVLTGFIGSGKTTLFNLICKINQPTKEGGKSVTRQTFLKQAAYGSGFRVLDTPGYGSKTDKIIHAVGILNALSEGPIHQILLVVKAERVDLMDERLQHMVVKFNRFRHLLTVVVTHWDNISKQDLEENKKLITQLSKDFGIKSVIFVSKNDSGEKVCDQIDSILNKCQAENVELTETEFYSSFDLVEMKKDVELQLACAKEDVEVKFENIANTIKNFIKVFPEKNPLMHEIMHQLTLETKKIAEKLISDFEIENNDKFSQLFEHYSKSSRAYFVHFELKKALMLQIDEIMKLSQEKMRTDKNHCFNFIKACPHCGLIWLKVSGCEGITNCGDFPDVDDDKFDDYKTPQKYKFTITENEISYELNQESCQSQLIAANKQQIDQKKLKGCGKPINWSEIPALTDYQLKELIDPGLMDYFAKTVSQEVLQKSLMTSQWSIKNQVEKLQKKWGIKQL